MLTGLFRANRMVEAVEASQWLEPPTPVHTVSAMDVAGLIGSGLSLDAALGVPAFARGLNLISGVAAGFPLQAWGGQTPNLLRGGGLSRQSVDALMISNTVRDLVCFGHAGWVVIGNHARRVRPDQLVQDDRGEIWADHEWTIAGYSGKPLPGDLLVFDSGSPGVLHSGWSTLQTALLLEQAAANLARSPVPSTVLKSRGLDLDAEQASQLLQGWEASRRRNATAYLSSLVDLEQIGFSAADLQLVEARNHSATEVARLLGIAAFWVDAGVPGASLTYQNREDQNQALLDTAVMPRLRLIEQVLSRYLSTEVRFDTTAFLRANFQQRAAVITQLLGAGVISIEEARAIEPLIHEGLTPE